MMKHRILVALFLLVLEGQAYLIQTRVGTTHTAASSRLFHLSSTDWRGKSAPIRSADATARTLSRPVNLFASSNPNDSAHAHRMMESDDSPPPTLPTSSNGRWRRLWNKDRRLSSVGKRLDQTKRFISTFRKQLVGGILSPILHTTTTKWLIPLLHRMVGIFLGTLVALTAVTVTTVVPAAHAASAPVMALPKAEGRDPASEALMEYERRQRVETQNELNDLAQRAREIERTQGEKARVKFEKEYKELQQQRVEEKAKALVELQRNLLDQGIDPFVDMEGQRQVTFFEKGVDLGDVQGTPFHLEKEFERTNYKRSMAFKKTYHRQVIASMVQDLKNRGMDPLDYFKARQTRTMAILDLPIAQARALAEQYAENLEKYGQITVPQPGEQSVLEQMKQKQEAENTPAAQKAAKAALKEEAIRLKAEAKAKAAEAKEQMKLEAKKQADLAQKQATAAAATAAKAAKDAAAAAAAAAAAPTPATSMSAIDEALESLDEDGLLDDDQDVVVDGTKALTPMSTSTSANKAKNLMAFNKKDLPIVPVSSFLVAVGGGAFYLKWSQDKKARDEEERKRRFQLLMGTVSKDPKKDGSDGASSSSSSSSLPSSSTSLLDDTTPRIKDNGMGLKRTSSSSTSSSSNVVKPTSPAPKKVLKLPEPPVLAGSKKKRRGLGVFSRRKNAREVDLSVLVSDEAKAPEFASLLAKLLTFGAPGRFPGVVALSGGDMPMEEFDLEAAKEMLVSARLSALLELVESAEIFADVVNCMLIDIVDLASSSLKEDDKTTIEAIDIVIDFMQHAASLYDAVAGDVVISPVTYGGTMSRSKLEQMYSIYSGSVMSNMENTRDDFDDRVRLLQDVFQISDKKAEGLMLKVMQKNMMEMLKSGEGLEGMQEMMQGMGAEGMPNGMPGADGSEPSPEQVKEMLLALKQMKDSGSFSKEDLDTIKKEFKASFGSSVEDLSKGQPLDATEQELLDLMKSILDD